MTNDYKLIYFPIFVKQKKADSPCPASNHSTRVRILGSKASGKTLILVLLKLKMRGRGWLGCRYLRVEALKL